jgi:hypothetical protein
MGRIGLYEYLGRCVPDILADGTRITESDNETYDDDGSLDAFTKLRDGATLLTKQDGETYDDDADLHPLSIPSASGTTLTSADQETYDDDPGLNGLQFPIRITSPTLRPPAAPGRRRPSHVLPIVIR